MNTDYDYLMPTMIDWWNMKKCHICGAQVEKLDSHLIARHIRRIDDSAVFACDCGRQWLPIYDGLLDHLRNLDAAGIAEHVALEEMSGAFHGSARHYEVEHAEMLKRMKPADRKLIVDAVLSRLRPDQHHFARHFAS